MLVDNGVRSDSRVQKCAKSMADHGWEVTLLGLSRSPSAKKWRLGKARIRVLPRSAVFERPAHEIRDPRLRDPLAYSSYDQADYRRAQVAIRRQELRPGQRNGGTGARRFRLAWQSRWVAFRAGRTDRVRSRREQLTGPLDRFTTWIWQSVLGDRCWRRLDPHLWDLEVALGPAIDRLRPDIIHANDWMTLGVAARAKARGVAAGRDIRIVWDAHEFLPDMNPWRTNPRWKVAQLAHEREYAPAADAVVTVSEALADLLQRTHHLPARPAVVLNCPESPSLDEGGSLPSVRDSSALPADVPLLVYSGGANPARGISTVVEALPQLDGVHLALVVSNNRRPMLASALHRADELEVAGRIHLLPYVPYDQVVPYLSSATIGLIPIHHSGNHEISLITKFFEYSQARLPIVVSDVKVMADQVRATGQGEVFRAEDVDDFARAVRKVLDDPDRYRRAYDSDGLLAGWTWEAQATILDGVYEELDTRPRRAGELTAVTSRPLPG